MTNQKQNILDNIKNYLISHKKELFIILLIFLLAFGVRAYLMKYDLMFAFDSYFHARLAGDVIQNGIPEKDTMAYYQEGGTYLPEASYFFWLFTATIYKIFTLGSPYNKELWILFVKILPALFGALISVGMYFLGKEMYNKETGIAMGFFAAIVPSFVYRTMAGFFEEDSLGFLWLVLGLIFLVKAFKQEKINKTSIKYGLISGLFLSLMAFTWEFFLIIPMILTSYFFAFIILKWFRNEDKKTILNFTKIFIIAFLTFSVISTIYDHGIWIQKTTSYVTQFLPVSSENIERFTATDRIGSKGRITVGEESLGFTFWGEKYNALIILAFFGIFLMLYRILSDKKDKFTLIIFFWTIITMYLAWYKLKFTYVFGLPLAACSAFVFMELFEFLKTRPLFEKKIVTIAMAFMCLIGVGSSVVFVNTKMPNIEMQNGWKEALFWMQKNTSEDSKFFNWWDEGHWITFVGERKVIIDNRLTSGTGAPDMANLLLSEDLNEALNILEPYDSDYLIISSDLLVKEGSLAIYAYNLNDTADPRIQRYFAREFVCNKKTNPLTKEITYVCEQNSLTEQQMSALPTTWSNSPNDLQDGRIPFFIYTTDKKDKLFILNPAVNSSNLAKLWFKHPDYEESFEEVFSNIGVKIFKVK